MSDIERAFDQCPDCGRYLVKLGSHSCRTAGGPPTREQRVRIARDDPRPDDDPVAVLPTRQVDGSYAYHETDEAGLPRCGGGGAIDDDTWRTLARAEAKDRGRSPCLTCLRLDGDDAVAEVLAETREATAGGRS